MPVEPSGPYSIPLAKLREHVAASASFQARVNLDEAGALQKVFGPVAMADDLDSLRPFAVVALGEDWSMDSIAGGARNEFNHTGSLTLHVSGQSRFADPLEDELDWGNFIGGLIGELADLAALDDNLVITGIRQTSLSRSDRREDKAGIGTWETTWAITYGDE